MRKKNLLVFGVALNDADYYVQPRINGKAVICPFYSTWKSMLERCYSEKLKSRRPSYTGCQVVTDWLVFSKFRKWMESQSWMGNQLDKDILIVGNKLYSPESCVFVSALTNSFIEDSFASRGDWPIGVHLDKATGKFMVQCRNPFEKKQEYIGRFNCPHEANLAWRRRKYEHACKIANLQSDSRVANAIILRYTLD